MRSNPLVCRQVEVNRSTADNWESFAPHRRRVTELLAGQGVRRGARLAVLGAGNCNDLDLKTLAASFAAVDLFDLDQGALSSGVRRQTMESSTNVYVHGGVDFTGVLPRLAALANSPDRQPELAELIRRAARSPRLARKQSYEVVASTCVLSQLISSAVVALGEMEPLLPILVLALRKSHFRLLCNMAAPGCKVVFVSDLVSSDTCPALLGHSGNGPRPLMEAAVRDRNFFTGLNPYAIAATLPKTVSDTELQEPWLWPLSSRRVALAYAVTFTVQKVIRKPNRKYL